MDTEENLPVWLDEHFLARLLERSKKGNFIKITSFKIKPAIDKGDNYCSSLLRVSVEYEENVGKPKRTSLIFKMPLPDGPGKEALQKLGLFEKERTIYKNLLPIMNRISPKQLAPKDFDCDIPCVIVQEDLKQHGYVMKDRLEQLDFEHCNAFMKVISVFHALSLQIEKDNPKLIEQVGSEIFYKEDAAPEFIQHFNNLFETFACTLETWVGFEKYSTFIRKNSEAILRKSITVMSKTKHLKVLNHGDTWTNNIMFKYNKEGEIIDLKLIDFQLCKFGSPAIDLQIFIKSSAQEYVKRHRVHELYATYLDAFNSTLEEIGCEVRLSAEQLQEEMKYFEVFNLCYLPSYFPMILCERENAVNMDEMIETWHSSDEKAKQHTFNLLNGKHFKPVAQYILNELEESGFFNSFN